MSIFQLLEWLPIKVAALNLPSRKKGSDVIHLTDIVVECEGSNALLNYFDPTLLDMLYREATSGDEKKQAEIEGLDIGISSKPMLRTSSLRSPILLSLEFVGYALTIDRGLGGKDSNITVDEITVKSIRLWPREGGSVKLSLHLQSRNVSDTQVGQLRALLKLETQMKLQAPQVRQTEISAPGKALDAELAGKPGVPDAAAKEHFSGHLASGTPLAAAKGASGAKPKSLTKAQQQAAARQAATDAFVDGSKKPAAH